MRASMDRLAPVAAHTSDPLMPFSSMLRMRFSASHSFRASPSSAFSRDKRSTCSMRRMSPGLASVTRDGLDPVQELHQHAISAAAAILVQLEHVSPDARRQGCSWLWRDDGNGLGVPLPPLLLEARKPLGAQLGPPWRWPRGGPRCSGRSDGPTRWVGVRQVYGALMRRRCQAEERSRRERRCRGSAWCPWSCLLTQVTHWRNTPEARKPVPALNLALPLTFLEEG